MSALIGRFLWGAPQIANERPQITQEEAKELIPYAFAAPAIQQNSWSEWLEPSGYSRVIPATLRLNLTGELKAEEDCFFDPETCLKVAVVRKGKELLVVFGALNSYKTGFWNLVGQRLQIFDRAFELIGQINAYALMNQFELALTGQGFGGGLASYVALKLDLRAICFNSLPLGNWLQLDGRDLKTRKITQLSVIGDWLSDSYITGTLPGRRLFLPSAYTKATETHIYIVGSFLAFLGHDKCAKPKEVVEQKTKAVLVKPPVPERPQLTQEEAKTLIHYTFTAPAIQQNSWEDWVKPSGFQLVDPASLLPHLQLPGRLEARSSHFFDPETSLKVAVLRKGNELVVVFGAINAFEKEVESKKRKYHLIGLIAAGALNLFLRRPLIFEQALQLVGQIHTYATQQQLELVLTGQSYGGGLASYVGLMLDVKSICFNSLPLGQWVKSEGRDLKTRKITQITVDTDWLSDHVFFTYQGILPGRRVFMPTAYPRSTWDTHAYIVGSFLVFLGYKDGTMPRDVVPQLAQKVEGVASPKKRVIRKRSPTY